MKILNDYEKGFIEAFIDTDGCIYIAYVKGSKCSYDLKMSFANNSRELLNKVQKILGTNKNLKSKFKKGYINPNYDLCYSVNVVRWVLPQLKLVIKERKRKLMLEMANTINIKNNRKGGNTKETCDKRTQLFKKWKSL